MLERVRRDYPSRRDARIAEDDLGDFPYWSRPPRAGSRGPPAGTPLLLREGVPPAGSLRGICGGRRYPPVTGPLRAGSAE